MADGIPITLDKARTLKYRFGDLKDVRRMLGGKTTTEIAMLILGADADAMALLLWAGLRHEDPALGRDLNKIDDAIQHYLSGGGQLYDLTTPILDALKAGGLIPKTFAERAAEAGESAAGP